MLLVVLGLAGMRSSYVQHKADASEKDDLNRQLSGVGNQLKTLNAKVEAQFAPPTKLSNKQRLGVPSLEPQAPLAQQAKPPEVLPIQLAATFANPRSPSVLIENRSDHVADRITWEAVLYRESDLALLSFATQDIGYVKPHSHGSNYSIDLPNVPKMVIGGRLPTDRCG